MEVRHTLWLVRHADNHSGRHFLQHTSKGFLLVFLHNELSNFVRSIGSPTKCERRTSPCRACTPTWSKRTVTRLWNSFDRERGLQSVSSHNIYFTQYPIDVTSNYCLIQVSKSYQWQNCQPIESILVMWQYASMNEHGNGYAVF